jgi:hypothetical protein
VGNVSDVCFENDITWRQKPTHVSAAIAQLDKATALEALLGRDHCRSGPFSAVRLTLLHFAAMTAVL